MENKFCNKCGECCKNIKIDFINNNLYFNGIQPLEKDFSDMLVEINRDEQFSYCICKYLQNNLCTNKNKPEICSSYPSSPFAFIPENCGYSGFVFTNNEKIKQNIRKLKEEIIHYTALLCTVTNKQEQSRLQKLVESHQKFIDKYKIYGSDNW